MASPPKIHLGQSIFIRGMRYFLRDRLTATGRVVFWLTLLANGTGSYSLVIKIYFVICILFALLASSLVLARLARVKLRVRADWPDRAVCGKTFRVGLFVQNLSRRPGLELGLRPLYPPVPMDIGPEDGVQIGRLPAGEQLKTHLDVLFDQRGVYVLEGMRQETTWPWGLWRDLVYHKDRRTLLVYPHFQPILNLDIPVGRRYQPGGIALTSYLGDSTEFLSTREFREGDPLRSIHWRSWARTGKPVVKEFQEEYFCRIALLLDTFLPLPRSRRKLDRGTFEAAVSLSAAVADRLAREEYVIDLFAAGPEIYHFQAGRSLAYLENVMDILSCIEPCHDPPFEKIEPVMLDYLENITTTVVVLLDWDERRERMIRVIQDRGSAVKIFLVRDLPPTLEPPPEVTRLSSGEVERGVESL